MIEFEIKDMRFIGPNAACFYVHGSQLHWWRDIHYGEQAILWTRLVCIILTWLILTLMERFPYWPHFLCVAFTGYISLWYLDDEVHWWYLPWPHPLCVTRSKCQPIRFWSLCTRWRYLVQALAAPLVRIIPYGSGSLHQAIGAHLTSSTFEDYYQALRSSRKKWE